MFIFSFTTLVWLQHVSKPAPQFCSSSPGNVQNNFHALFVFAETCANEVHYDTKVYMMHGVAHKHLVNTEMLEHPERIEQQIFASSLTTSGSWYGPHIGSIFVPYHDGLFAGHRSHLTPRKTADLVPPSVDLAENRRADRNSPFRQQHR